MGMLQYWRELLSPALLALAVLAEQFYRDPLYDPTLQFIASWQQHSRSALNDRFFRAVSSLGSLYGLCVLLAAVLSLAPRRIFIKLNMVLVTITVVCFMSHYWYRGPRPYSSSDSVTAVDCATGYGNPSFHTTLATAVYGSLWGLVFFGTDVQFSPGWKRLAAMWGTLFLVVCHVVLTMFSRMYLGVHFISQVIYGLTLGLWAAYTFVVALNRHIDAHIDFVTVAPNQFAASAGTVGIFTIFLAFHALNVTLYSIYRDVTLGSTMAVRANAKCPANPDPSAKAFSGVIYSFRYFLLYISQRVSARYFPHVYRLWSRDNGAVKSTLRLLIVVSVFLLCCLPVRLVHGRALWMKLVLGSGLGAILMAFVGVPLIDWGSEKLVLVAKEEKPDPEAQRYGTIELSSSQPEAPR